MNATAVATMTPRPRRLHLLRWLPGAWVTTAGPGGRKALYLSFDDGPHPEHTLPLLDLLARHGVQATFFLVGNQVERHPALVEHIVAAGHTLGNHSYDHPRFERLSLHQQLEQIDRTDALLERFDGRARHPFRPPRGVLPLPLLAHFVRHRRPIAYWSYDSLDYGHHPAPWLIEVARRHPPRGRDIILMHDDSTTSRQMLATLIPEWMAEGFTFAAMDGHG